MSEPNNDEAAKNQLANLLERYTTGSVLHLLAELHRTSADEALEIGNETSYDQLRHIEHTLIVVGMGIDAVDPS